MCTFFFPHQQCIATFFFGTIIILHLIWILFNFCFLLLFFFLLYKLCFIVFFSCKVIWRILTNKMFPSSYIFEKRLGTSAFMSFLPFCFLPGGVWFHHGKVCLRGSHNDWRTVYLQPQGGGPDLPCLPRWHRVCVTLTNLL